jgi:guanylate kinase
VKPFPLVLSSPSGGGKSTIRKLLLEQRRDLGYSVSATTRKIRAAEKERNGVEYFFLGRPEFEARRDAGEFVEWASYAGELYGTLKSEFDRLFGEGRHPVLDIEIEGARQIREKYPEAVRIFVLPPSGTELVQRLRGRNTEPPEVVGRRLDRAAVELGAAADYDYVIVNDEVAAAVSQISAILDAEGRKVARQPELNRMIAQLQREVRAEAERLRPAGERK